MAVQKHRRKKARKIRYKLIKIRLTSGQKVALDKYCTAHHTTPVRAIKKAIQPILKRYDNEAPSANHVSEHQIDLFQMIEEVEMVATDAAHVHTADGSGWNDRG